ncbi:MAG TPA: VOC family protein, partial [Streptosporangiaceae bacterium]|nr:VOC family protein [Streptosporangiaceae bacterium]
MSVNLYAVTVDCSDAARLASFWASVLGRAVDEGGTRDFAAIGLQDPAESGARWMFVKVPEGKREVQQPMLTRAYASLAAGKRLAPQRCAGRSEGHAAGAGHWAAGRVTSPGEAGYSEGKPTAGCG